jgi:hypothetical protein
MRAFIGVGAFGYKEAAFTGAKKVENWGNSNLQAGVR